MTEVSLELAGWSEADLQLFLQSTEEPHEASNFPSHPEDKCSRTSCPPPSQKLPFRTDTLKQTHSEAESIPDTGCHSGLATAMISLNIKSDTHHQSETAKEFPVRQKSHSFPLSQVGDEALIEAAGLHAPLSNGWNLYPHQQSAVISCIKEKRSILAFDMGLGKTMIALFWAKAFNRCYQSCLICIISPCTLIENWRREAETVFGERKTVESSCRFFSWAKIPEPSKMLAESGFASFVLICDEAHAMQSMKSKRTIAALELCKSHVCRGTILATGRLILHLNLFCAITNYGN